MENDIDGFSRRKRLRSFRAAIAGLKALFVREHNARIHLVVAVLVVLAGIAFSITVHEWLAVTLVIGLVLVAELVNSAVEELADVLTLEYDHRIRRIKDYCAGAVLVAAIISVVVGLLIFVPKIVAFLQ